MKLHAWMGRIHLQVERRGLNGLLFLVGQPCQAGGEGVEAEVHDLRLFLIFYLINIFFANMAIECSPLKIYRMCFYVRNSNI